MLETTAPCDAFVLAGSRRFPRFSHRATGLLLLVALSASLIACGVDDGTGGALGEGGRAGGAGSSSGGGGGGSETCEADLTSDPANCGACAHSCAGGACVAGRCQPVELALFDSETRPNGITLNRDSVFWFWTFGNKVGQLRKDGSGSDTWLAPYGPSDIEANDTHVFWSTTIGGSGSEAVYRRSLAEGGWEGVAIGNNTYELALDDQRFYVTQPNDRQIVSALHDGSDWRSWDATGDQSLQVDDERLYWIQRGYHDVVSCPKNGCATVTRLGLSLTTFSDEPGLERSTYATLALDRTDAFVADVNGILRVDKRGGTPTQLTSDRAEDLALDDSFVYYGVATAGEVRRVPKQGGAVEVLATGQNYPYDVAVDEVAVYWLAYEDGAIRKVAKPAR